MSAETDRAGRAGAYPVNCVASRIARLTAVVSSGWDGAPHWQPGVFPYVSTAAYTHWGATMQRTMDLAAVLQMREAWLWSIVGSGASWRVCGA